MTACELYKCLPMVLALLCFFHYVGDFYLQSAWMAKNKSRRFIALAAHVSIYTLTLAAGTVLFLPNWTTWGIWLALNAVLHFVTDTLTSQWTTYYKEKENERAYYRVLGFDQFLHQLALLLTFQVFFL